MIYDASQVMRKNITNLAGRRCAAVRDRVWRTEAETPALAALLAAW